MVLQGFTTAQRLPSKDTTKPMPTHQIIQTKVGVKLSTGRSDPKSPVAMTRKKSSKEASRTSQKTGPDKAARNGA